MKKFLSFLAILVGVIALGVLATILFTPWMDRWGATDAELAATYPGDELLPNPASFVNRAITINASPEAIYPWLVQLDANKGGWYSYDWLETNLLRCPMVNADRIHPEWQNLQVGDKVHMCPGDAGPAAECSCVVRRTLCARSCFQLFELVGNLTGQGHAPSKFIVL